MSLSAFFDQTVAAWVQAIGSILAIIVAYHLGNRQSKSALVAADHAHRLAMRTRIDGYLAVAGAAMIHARQFSEALSAADPRLALAYVYDKSVVQAARSAMLSIPPHDLGVPKAVVPLLSMSNQLVFIENAMETYLAGPANHPEISKALESYRARGYEAQLAQAIEHTTKVLAGNVKVHLRRLEEDYLQLGLALDRSLP